MTLLLAFKCVDGLSLHVDSGGSQKIATSEGLRWKSTECHIKLRKFSANRDFVLLHMGELHFPGKIRVPVSTFWDEFQALITDLIFDETYDFASHFEATFRARWNSESQNLYPFAGLTFWIGSVASDSQFDLFSISHPENETSDLITPLEPASIDFWHVRSLKYAFPDEGHTILDTLLLNKDIGANSAWPQGEEINCPPESLQEFFDQSRSMGFEQLTIAQADTLGRRAMEILIAHFRSLDTNNPSSVKRLVSGSALSAKLLCGNTLLNAPNWPIESLL